MGDSLSIIFAVLVGLILLFFVPLVDTWELQDNLAYVVSYASTTEFVDEARNMGGITIDNYQNYINRLNSTGNIFMVSMERRSLNEHLSSMLMAQNLNSTTGSGKFKYVNVYLNTYTKEILDKLEAHGFYPLDKHDYFFVSIKNMNITQASIITNMFLRDKTEFKIGCVYGGIVWDDKNS